MQKTITKLKYKWFHFVNWLHFRKKLFHLWWANAPKHQFALEKGSHYLRLGAVVQVGQPIVLKDKFGKRVRYVKNLHFDFSKNKIVATYSDKPIPGVSEKFVKKKNKSLKVGSEARG